MILPFSQEQMKAGSQVPYTCPDCGSASASREVDGVDWPVQVLPCDCAERRRLEKARADYVRMQMEYAGIPEMFYSVELEDVERRPGMDEAIDTVREYINAMPGIVDTKDENVKKGLALYGTCGNGKTMLCSVILKEWSKMVTDASGYMLDYREMLTVLNAKDVDEQLAYWHRKCVGMRLLVIDDMACETVPEWRRSWLGHLIDERYKQRKATLITSNCKTEERLHRIGAGLESRIAGMCKVIPVVAKDYRKEAAR